MSSFRPCVSPRRQQRGVALFVALISMVVLSLAGIALVRSVDSTSSVATNISFRQGSIGPVNYEIEKAIFKLFKSATPINQLADDVPNAYYAELQPLEKNNGIPNVLAGDYATMTAAYNGAGLPAVVADPVTLMEVRAVTERICSAAGLPTIATCDTLPPKTSKAGTDNKPLPKQIPLPPIPNFRITVRVDLPNSNTVSHAQAIMR
jgi:type IV pilus assembly protein PilX